MLINSKTPRNPSKIVLWSAIAILLLLGLNAIVQNKGGGLKNILGDTNKSAAAGGKTEVASMLYTENLLTDTVNRVYQQENLTLYLNNELGAPTLMAVYKDSLSELQENGRFLVFLYLKDPSKWRSVNKKWDHILLTKEQLIPITKVVDNRPHYIFKFRIEHPYFNIENLKELEFVRHSREFGRFEEGRINPDSLGLIYTISNTLDNLHIAVSKKRMQKITDKRNHALESGILITNDEDFVNATITNDGKEYIKANMRLKGDWTDHLEHPTKWSYRVVPVGEQTVFGMRKFSVQHPKSRNYLWEWLFNKVVKDNDLIGLRYDFLNVTLNISDTDSIIPMGIMALEESFDKILIENNSRREGLILGFDESGMWDERKQLRDLSLDLTKDMDLPKARELPVKVYNENKTLSSPVLSRQFTIAKNLLLGLRDGQLKLSEAFDVDKLTTYIALSNLFGGHHGLHIENIRIYYNPVTNKLEPVSFDSNSGYSVSFLRGYPIGLRDAVFEEKLVEKYELISSTEFVSGFVRKYEKALNALTLNLSGEFNESSIDFSILEHNANLIKKKILPANIIDATLLSYDNTAMEVEIKNLSEFPAVIEDLVLTNKKSLNENNNRQLVPAKDTILIRFQLKKSFNNAFVSKKNKEGGFRYPKDLSKIRLSHHLLGSGQKKYKAIRAFNSKFEAAVVTNDRPRPHLQDFNFITVDEEKNTLKFKTGSYELTELLFIPAEYEVLVPQGFELNLVNNASIISYSPFRCMGSKDKPIRFYSEDSSGGGIFISSADRTSLVSHTYFTNLSVPQLQYWTLSGAVNFNETDVSITNSVFEKNRSEDALNIIRSTFTMDSIQFKNTYSDSFDGDFVKGKISNSIFSNSGNDGIDVSGSVIEVENVTIVNPSDKAMSAGEGSTINGRDIEIQDGEIGLVSKDLSRINIYGISILNTRLAISCFQKKTEYGPGLIDLKNVTFSGNELAYLIAPGSDLIIDDKIIQDKTEGVIDKMYGSEYGKSSR